MFVAALFLINPNWKQHKCKWIMDKLTYLYYGMLFSN